MTEYDAIIIGSGPNGFAAAITLQQQGLKTLLMEGAETIGGGMRSQALTIPGFLHDVCSAIHPMALASPFFASLPLADFGLEFTYAPIELAHPLDDGTTALMYRDLAKTAEGLGVDGARYADIMAPIVKNWESLALDTMGSLRFPKNPLLLARFGLTGLRSAASVAKGFKTEKAKALWAGLAAHGIQPLSNLATAAIGMMLSGTGHRFGWPIPVGGSQTIGHALERYYLSLGGKIETGAWLTNVADLPAHKLLIADLTPKQLLAIEGLDFTATYRRQLQRFRQGMGVFKMDWALSEATPFKDKHCQEAATVHLGNSFAEIALAEQLTQEGRIVEKPFVLFAQQSLFDKSRAPAGKHTGWAYCHVPNGSTVDRTQAIEDQIERYAPGFKDTIIGRSTMNAQEMGQYNPNYVGGDINGGLMDIRQLYTRPTCSLTPYRTSNKRVYIASSSTPPGGGVHGMCGFHAARIALKDHYQLEINL